MKKRFYFMLLVLFSIGFNQTGNAQTPYTGGGDGTVATPYILLNAADLQLFSATTGDAAAGVYVELGADIDMAAVASFTPIGLSGYSGNFDGKNFCISNLTIAGGATKRALFSYMKGNAVVQNLCLKNLVLDNTTTALTAGISGTMGTTNTITNCCLIGGRITGGGRTGSIVGRAFGGSVTNCFSSANINSNNDGKSAGLIGQCNDAAMIIQNNIFYGIIENLGHAVYAGTVVTTGGHNYHISTCGGNVANSTELTPVQMHDSTYFKGLDFISATPVWAMAGTVVSGSTFTGYPVLNSFGTATSELTLSSGFKDAWNHGTIAPFGLQTVAFGAAQSYLITPHTGYTSTFVWLNGVIDNSWAPSSTAATYTIDPAVKNDEVRVFFSGDLVTSNKQIEGQQKIFVAGNILHIASTQDNNTIKVYNLSGALVLSENFSGNTYSRNLTWNKGIYLVQLNNNSISEKILLR